MLRELSGPGKVLHLGRNEHRYFTCLSLIGFQACFASRVWFSKYF